MAVRTGTIKRVFDDIKVRSQQQFKAFVVDFTQEKVFFFERRALHKLGEKGLDFVEVFDMEEIKIFSWHFENAGDGFIVK